MMFLFIYAQADFLTPQLLFDKLRIKESGLKYGFKKKIYLFLVKDVFNIRSMLLGFRIKVGEWLYRRLKNHKMTAIKGNSQTET